MSSSILAQGLAALRAGDLSTAERLLLTIIQRDTNAHRAWHMLSIVAVRAGLPDVGVERARRAVALDRQNADYLNSLGIAHGESDELAAAEQAFRRALKINPAYAEAHYNLAKVLRKQDRLDESLREYERAHALEPRAVPAQLGLASVYGLHGQPERALAMLRAAVREGTPDDDQIAYLMVFMAEVEGPEAAIAWLRGLLAQRPDWQQAHYMLAVLLLSVGQWREGWKHYLWRPHGDANRMSTRPAVLPARLDGKRIVLRAEQGIGDILFFLRFADELRDRGATIALDCPPSVAKLGPVLAEQIALDGAADLQVWVADLPALLQTEATPPAVVLRADDTRRAHARDALKRLGPAPYLGLTWRAGTQRPRVFGPGERALVMLFKEISPALLGEAVRGWSGTIVSLQRGLTPAERDALRAAAGVDVHDLGAATEDLQEALALLSELDEYVAVSNTNIHLLASLGRTARVLVPRHPPEWRWMREGKSAWFPQFTVYRQPVSLDWSEPLAGLKADLQSSRSR